jgi:hypothetical protein
VLARPPARTPCCPGARAHTFALSTLPGPTFSGPRPRSEQVERLQRKFALIHTTLAQQAALASAASGRPSEVSERMSLVSLTESVSLSVLGAAARQQQQGAAAARYGGGAAAAAAAAAGGRYGAPKGGAGGEKGGGGPAGAGGSSGGGADGPVADQGPLMRGGPAGGPPPDGGKVGGPRAHAVALSTASLAGK